MKSTYNKKYDESERMHTTAHDNTTLKRLLIHTADHGAVKKLGLYELILLAQREHRRVELVTLEKKSALEYCARKICTRIAEYTNRIRAGVQHYLTVSR